jgi:hypothetical protein
MGKPGTRAKSAIDGEAGLRILSLAEKLFDQMIEQQRAKVFQLARQAVPRIGPEDVLNPDDFPELKAHPTFEYEDGILAGLIAAQVALRTELRTAFYPTAVSET